jgi:hypothetical protein
MPTKNTKGNHGHPDHGSKESGNQKATYGSAVSPEVAEGQREGITGEEPVAEEATD